MSVCATMVNCKGQRDSWFINETAFLTNSRSIFCDGVRYMDLCPSQSRPSVRYMDFESITAITIHLGTVIFVQKSSIFASNLPVKGPLTKQGSENGPLYGLSSITFTSRCPLYEFWASQITKIGRFVNRRVRESRRPLNSKGLNLIFLNEQIKSHFTSKL